VFEQKQVIGHGTVFSGGEQLLLQFECGPVGDAAEFADLALTH